MWTYNYNSELYHHGIKGQRWGVRRTKKQLGYKSTSISAARARKSNEKVDKSFNNWKENSQKKQNAIDLGKKATDAKIAYENNKTDKSLKREYKDSNKVYKKALSENTTYRKGSVRQEVGRDASRKYMSEAKKVKAQLNSDPSNKVLQKKYSDLMSKHDIERAKAKRSAKQASFKRTMTMTVKTVATATAVAAGAYAINRALDKSNVTMNGRKVSFSKETLSNVVDFAKKGKDFMGYMY